MMIASLLDNDLYKFTMMQAVYHKFSHVDVEYKFICRNKGTNVHFTQKHVDEIKEQIRLLCELRFDKSDLEYLRSLRFIKPDFVEFLKLFYFDEKFVFIEFDEHNNNIEMRIKGPWLYTILFEVPILAIVNEVYSASQCDNTNIAIKNIFDKMKFVKNNVDCEQFKFTDFGTRRRFSCNWHRIVIDILLKGLPNSFIGTSNLHYAKEFGILPIGTMAHEWLQAHQALYKIEDSQRIAFQNWANEYRGDLGIALTDVIGVRAFLDDFDLYFAKLFDGVRHDSGNPFAFGELILDHYRKMKINPKTKTIVFSDSLNFESAINIFNEFSEFINVSFGIGTNLTNDMGFSPLQSVIKMVKCNGRDVAKISDEEVKVVCENDEYVRYLKHVYKYMPLVQLPSEVLS